MWESQNFPVILILCEIKVGVEALNSESLKGQKLTILAQPDSSKLISRKIRKILNFQTVLDMIQIYVKNTHYVYDIKDGSCFQSISRIV